MSIPYLNRKIEERATLSAAIESMLDKSAEKGDDPTPEQRSQMNAWGDQIKTLDAEILELRTTIDANDRFEKTVAHVSEIDEKRDRRDAARRDAGPVERRMSYGESFVTSDAFKTYRGRGSMEPVEFEGFLENRAAIDLATLDLPPYQWSGPREYRTTTPLLDALGRERVSQNSVEYITWGTADPVAGGPIAEGALKPEADMAPEPHTVTLATYAHWKAITRQALEDYSRIRSIVEGKLRGGLASKLETVAMEVLTADTNVGTVVNADILAGIRIAIGDIQWAGYNANAILLNPEDYANLDIAAAEASNSGPTSFGAFWGLRPIAVGALPVGTAYVGDFVNGMTWFDRNTTAVYMTDSHADYFVRNLLLILAEQRAAFAVTEPLAIAKVTTTAPAVATASASK